MSGKSTASIPPFGYMKDPEAAEVVRRVFPLTIEAHGPYQICCIPKNDKVEIPGYYLAQRVVGLHKSHVFADPCNWSSSTVCSMLKKREYLGHRVNFKSKKVSCKDKKNTYVPEDEWLIFPNTHKTIIDEEIFENVQRIRGGVKCRPDSWGYVPPLTGRLYCSDCGGKMYVHRISNGKDCPKYVCGNYTKYISAKNGKVASGFLCKSAHRIDAATVMQLISDTLKAIAKYAREDKAAFTKQVKETITAQQTGRSKRKKSGGKRAAQFIALVKRYEDFDELTTAMLNEFVEKIIVHERDRKGSSDTTQKVEIHLNFIGQFAPQEPIALEVLAAMEEEQRKKEARKDRLHQNYLKRKANGKQKEYEKRYHPKRKARMAEKKAALFAEGAVLGGAAASDSAPPVAV